MAEALLALGLACNVIQIISFSLETLAIANKIRKEGSFNTDLAQNVQRIEKLSQELEISMQNFPQGNQAPQSQTPQSELIDIARDCNSIASQMTSELSKISNSKGGTFGKTLNVVYRKSKLEKMEKTMTQCQQSLNSRLLQRLWYISLSSVLRIND
jgi:hypothetical protein